MKAISLWQPWASAMAEGFKRIETRSWPINYRGDLVICAAKRQMDSGCLSVARYHGIPVTGMKFGFALCVVEVYGCEPTESELPALRAHGREPEIELGDYSAGRFAWLTRNLRKLKTPVPIIGRQGLWDLPEESVRLINANLQREYEVATGGRI